MDASKSRSVAQTDSTFLTRRAEYDSRFRLCLASEMLWKNEYRLTVLYYLISNISQSFVRACNVHMYVFFCSRGARFDTWLCYHLTYSDLCQYYIGFCTTVKWQTVACKLEYREISKRIVYQIYLRYSIMSNVITICSVISTDC